MRVAYDADVDILTIDFDNKNIKVSGEVLPGVIADFGHEGQLAGFEIMDASKFTDLSQINVFMSLWGVQERALDANGDFSLLPKTINTVSGGN